MSDEQARREQARQAVRAAALPGATRTGLEQVQRKTRRTLDAQLLLVRNTHARLACTRGCDMCCHLRVMATPAEVFALLGYMRGRLSREEFDTFSARIHNTAAQLHALPRERLLSTNVACPLLVEGACGLYPARPFNCRAYHSLDRDACLASFLAPKDPNLTHPQSALISRINEGVQQGLIDVLASLALDAHQYELVTALDEALSDPQAEPRFLRGQPAFVRALRL